MSLASIELLLGISMLSFGLFYGTVQWFISVNSHISAPLGTMMLATLSIIIGIQFIMAFFPNDISNIPSKVIWKNLIL